MKVTFFNQLFSGFFLIFWAIMLLFLVTSIISLCGNDIGLGDGKLLFYFSIGLIVLIVLINYFNREQRAARNQQQ